MTELPLFVFWSEFMGWILDRTEDFPRKARNTFGCRIDNLTLDILEAIVEATYTSKGQKAGILKKINLNLEKIRVLLRLCSDRKYLNPKSLRYAAEKLEETGKMVGGWIKNQEEL